MVKNSPIADRHPLRLRKRAEFLAVQRAEKHRGSHFLLETRKRQSTETPGPESPARIGFTVSRKCGNAVKRNRIKRRLREIARMRLARDMQAGTDYVIVARAELLTMPFEQIADALVRRLQQTIEKESKTEPTDGI